MKQYLDGLQEILDNGDQQPNRTGIDTLTIPGFHMRFDLQKGFPAVTTKKLAWKAVAAELCGFLRGVQSAADFRALGTKIWDQNANENTAWLANPFRKGEDDLGPVYGAQWRKWPAYKVLPLGEHEGSCALEMERTGWARKGWIDPTEGWGFSGVLYHKKIDQLGDCIRKIITNPTDRRILFHAWNPAVLDEMALVPCHLLYQFLPNINKRELSMNLYIRSNDAFLGAPFNIASAALLLSIVAQLTGYKPKWFNYFVGDWHLYVNHIEQAKEQLTREPYPLPTLKINKNSVLSYQVIEDLLAEKYGKEKDLDLDGIRDEAIELVIQSLDRIEPSDFELENYQHHEPIKADMAV